MATNDPGITHDGSEISNGSKKDVLEYVHAARLAVAVAVFSVLMVTVQLVNARRTTDTRSTPRRRASQLRKAAK
ncbi:MAG: hypothetical protein M3N46_08915 [Actinomycetota bacterium]|nr:hypothetical protein [Actinomycetota bacterium]